MHALIPFWLQSVKLAAVCQPHPICIYHLYLSSVGFFFLVSSKDTMVEGHASYHGCEFWLLQNMSWNLYEKLRKKQMLNLTINMQSANATIRFLKC